MRGGRRHFVYSKLQCWVALDRSLRLAAKRSLPVDRERLGGVRDRIYETIMAQGYDPKRRTFVQSFGSAALDASPSTAAASRPTSSSSRRSRSPSARSARSEGALGSVRSPPLISDEAAARSSCRRWAGSPRSGAGS